jgi:salicylate hydroxylase
MPDAPSPSSTKPVRRNMRAHNASESRHAPQILIIGAGIGGLTAALSLQRQGFSVRVYERMAELSELGAGVIITPNALHGLDFLGVGAPVRATANFAGDLEFRHYKTAELLGRRRVSDISAKFGAAVFQVHRADLHRALSSAVLANDRDSIRLDHAFVDLFQDDTSVVARFANGAVIEGHTLIGCDGGRSIVREKIHGDEPVSYAGQVALRAIVPADELPSDIELQGRCVYIGLDRMFMHYGLRKNSLMNVIAIARQREWQADHWATQGDIQELSRLYSDFHPRVLAIIASIKHGALFKWGLHDREPLPRWTVGRVSLLGDAAHPFTPFLGQGACMAIEDGTVLGRCFAECSNPAEALRVYESARKVRANTAQLRSRARAKALQGGFLDISGAESDADDIALFDSLFDYNPASVSIGSDAITAPTEQKR